MERVERKIKREQCTGISQGKHFPKMIDWENERDRFSQVFKISGVQRLKF